MTIIRSLAHQWDKAEFAHHLEQCLSYNQEVMNLFLGSTRCHSVCHLIAAIGELPPKSKEGCFDITPHNLLDILLQCFLLIYVKAVNRQILSQGEQLILSISEIIAQQMINGSEGSRDIFKKSQIILNATNNLKKEQSKLRQQHFNMGKI